MRLTEILVRVPKETGLQEKLYITGNHPALGAWKLPGIPLQRGGPGLFLARLALPEGQTIECKVHRGSWKKVEKGADGEDIPNHRLIVKAGKRLEIKVARWKPREKPANSTATGDIRYHKRFVSKHLGNSRTMAVWLPPQYELQPQRHFPVLYLHDGQNLFDVATAFAGVEWGADKTALRLIEAGRLEPVIMVGVYNNEDRLNEYAPISEHSRQAGGKGMAYGKFIVEEVKPFIDRTYRTLPQAEHTGVAGSSLGGLISLYLGLEYPQVFSKLGVISPALWWGRSWILGQARRKGKCLRDHRVWVDMGTQEWGDPENSWKAIQQSRDLVRIFDRHSMLPGRDYYYHEVYDGLHNEAAWAERLDLILLYFWGLPPAVKKTAARVRAG